MPKSKPTQVIVHRIELQDKEREMVEAIVAGKTVEAVGKGAVYVVGAGALAAGAYVAWWTLDTVYGWGKTAVEYADVIASNPNEANPAYWAVPAPLRVLWGLVDDD